MKLILIVVMLSACAEPAAPSSPHCQVEIPVLPAWGIYEARFSVHETVKWDALESEPGALLELLVIPPGQPVESMGSSFDGAGVLAAVDIVDSDLLPGNEYRVQTDRPRPLLLRAYRDSCSDLVETITGLAGLHARRLEHPQRALVRDVVSPAMLPAVAEPVVAQVLLPGDSHLMRAPQDDIGREVAGAHGGPASFEAALQQAPDRSREVATRIAVFPPNVIDDQRGRLRELSEIVGRPLGAIGQPGQIRA